LKVQATWAGLSTTANHVLCISLSQGSVKTLQPDFLWPEYGGSHWNEKKKSWPGGSPGEEQKSHLWRSYAVDKLLAKLGLTAPWFVNRPLSWPGSEYAGTHPRTKGAQCFPGGPRGWIRSPRRMTAVAL